MMNGNRAVLGAALVAVAIAMTPTAGEAAWWPWSKKKEAPPVQPQIEQPVPITPPAADSAGALQNDPAVDRLSQIEEQMRSMTGRIEELTFQVQQLQQQLQQVQAAAGNGAARKSMVAAKPAPEATGGVIAVAKQPAPVPDMSNAAPAADDAGTGAPPRQLGTLTVGDPSLAADGKPVRVVPLSGGDAAPMAAPLATPAAEAAAPQPSVLASLGDPRSDYERAYGDILSGDYDKAEAGFRQFLATHPDDARAADAQYWLGESLFERGRFRDAANEFLNGHKAYPKSDKGPDTLLKLGLSLAGLGERDAACQTYGQVLKQYPRASNAMRTRVANEQASASC